VVLRVEGVGKCVKGEMLYRRGAGVRGVKCTRTQGGGNRTHRLCPPASCRPGTTPRQQYMPSTHSTRGARTARPSRHFLHTHKRRTFGKRAFSLDWRLSEAKRAPPPSSHSSSSL
jgi:hypothetical protein